MQGKDRSACLVAASDSQAEPRFVVLLPISHTPPDADTIGIEIPVRVKQAVGFDDAPSWVIVSEYNVDEWPNGGLSAVLGKPDEFRCDFIPPGLFARIKAKFLELAHERKSQRYVADQMRNHPLLAIATPIAATTNPHTCTSVSASPNIPQAISADTPGTR